MTEHNHVVGHDLISRALGAVLGDVRTIAQSTLDVELAAFLDVLLDDVAEFAPGDDVVEVDRFLLGFRLGIVPGVIRGQAEARDVRAGAQAARLRIPNHIPDQGDFIQVHILFLS